MTNAVLLIAKYQTWIYALLGLGALLYLYRLEQARGRLRQTLFGLEKEAALQKQSNALFMLIILISLAISIFVINRYVIPNLGLLQGTPAPGASPLTAGSPTPNLLPATPGPLSIDSSGCSNPKATLTEPTPGTQVAGSFEVRGTADIDNFAFYTFEINGASTSGAWVSLYVGTTPVVNGTLGSFDTSAYQSGEYAFRLVVKDSAGNFPTPCVVPINLVNIGENSSSP
jgi:hypothetical protein